MKKTSAKKSLVKHQVSSSLDLPSVLIAGGAGFIGSHLTQLLLEQNCQVFCLDNLLTGKKENIAAFKDKENFQFIDHDVLDSMSQLKLPSLDYIFHLARVENYFIDKNKKLPELKTILVNSLGTRNLLELAKEHQAKFLLGSTPAVFEGQIALKDLKNYFGKKESSQSYYSLAEAKRFSESLVFEYFKAYDLDCRIVRFDNIYGPFMPLESNNIMASFFKSISIGKPISVPGKGSQLIHPTFIEDLVYGLLKAMFDQNSKGRIYYLEDSFEIKIIDLAHLIQKNHDLDTEIEYTAFEQKPNEKEEDGDISDKEELIKVQEELNWYPKTSLEQGLIKTLEWLKELKTIPENEDEAEVVEADMSATADKPLDIEVDKTEELEKTEKVNFSQKIISKIKLPRIHQKLKIKKPKNKLYYLITIILLTLFLIISILPIVSFIFCLDKAYKKFELNQYQEAIVDLQKSQKIFSEFSFITRLPPFKKKKNKINSLISLGIKMLEIKSSQVSANQHFYNLTKMVIKGERGDFITELSSIKIYLDKVYQDLSFLESELDNYPKDEKELMVFQKLNDRLNNFKEQVPSYRKKVNLFREVLEMLPKALAFEGKKTYLILMQNNLELRPTGGYIGSFGLLTFEKGRLLDFEIKEVAYADNQLKGNVEPPKILKKYLGELNWYLRDSNWQVDFPSSAKQAEWFIDKEINKNVDGVIGLNLYFIQNVLKQLGPVQLLNENETITAENLFERGLSFSQVDYSPESKEADFLGNTVNLIFEKIKKMNEEDFLKLFASFEQSFEERQLLISFDNNNINSLFEKNGWSGAVRQQNNIVNKSVFGDYLMLSEANLGVNKVNHFIKRRLSQEVTILEEGDLIETFKAEFTNTSSSQSWPGGDYKNYLRLYVPNKAHLIKIEIGDNENSFIVLSDTKIDYFEEYGKRAFGVLLNVPAKEKRSVKITYQTKDRLAFENNLATYLFYWQKQSGINNDELELKINYPKNIMPVKIAPQAKMADYQIQFLSDTTKDRIFLIDFKK